MQERIKACFTESIQTQIAAAEALPDAISRAAMTLVQSLLNGNKILCCGNGTSAANAQHFAASMINRFETERPSLPAIALNTDNVVLTAIANDRLHDEVYAKLVIIAEGSNTLLLEKAGLTAPTDPSTMAVGVKEVYKLKKEDLENRLMLSGDDGMAWLTLGDMTSGLLGGGFIYTNKDSLSVGMVVGLEDIGKANRSVDDMLSAFTSHPRIAPLLKNGQLKEHSAHLVPEGGYKSMPKLGGNGYIIVGDAARMCMNLGYTIRGMDLAIESGMCAADAVNVALRDENMERVAKLYERQIKASWLLKDLKRYKNMPKFLATHPRIFNEYPAFVNNLMRDVFTVNGDGAVPMMKKIMRRVGDIGLFTLIRDAWKGVRSL